MDQETFRQTYREINERDCVYEKAVLTNQVGCRHAERFCIAEREGLTCHSAEGRERCRRWLDRVREETRFALKTAADGGHRPLGHGKAIAAQVGGLRGLYLVLYPDAVPPATIADVDALLNEAVARHSGFEAIDMAPVVRQVAAYKIKKRARRRR